MSTPTGKKAKQVSMNADAAKKQNKQTNQQKTCTFSLGSWRTQFMFRDIILLFLWWYWGLNSGSCTC
jgi:hypothetical protein